MGQVGALNRTSFILTIILLGLAFLPVSFASVNIIFGGYELEAEKNDQIYVGQDVQVSFTLRNSDSRNIEDVRVTITLENGNGDILTDKAGEPLEYIKDVTEIDKFETKKINWAFVFPDDYHLDDDNEIVINVEGHAEGATSKDDEDFDFEEKFSIDIEDRKYEVSWPIFRLSEESLECGKQAYIEYEVRNVGESDESSMTVQMITNEIGLNYKSDTFELEKNSATDSYDNSVDFTVPSDAKSGQYNIQATLNMRNSVKKYSPRLTLNVSCLDNKPEQPAEEKKEEPPEKDLAENTENQTTQEEIVDDSVEEETDDETAQEESSTANQRDKSDNLTIFILVFAGLAIIVIAGMFFLIKKIIREA